MPRRKKVDEVLANPTPPESPTPTPKTRTRRPSAKKSLAIIATLEDLVTEPTPVTEPVAAAKPPAKKRTARKTSPTAASEPTVTPEGVAAEVSVAVPPKRASSRRKQTSVLEPAPEAPEPVVEPVAKAESGEPFSTEDWGFEVVFRPRSEVPTNPEPAELDPSDLGWPDDEAPILTWRPSARKAKAGVPPLSPAIIEASAYEPPTAEEIAQLESLAADVEVGMPEWRSRSARPLRETVVQPDPETSPESDERRTRRRRRSRGGRADDTLEPTVDTATVESAPEPIAPVLVPVERKIGPPPKPLIPIPNDAPQIVVRDGIPTLVRNGRVYPPLAVFGNARDPQRLNNVLHEMRLAGESDVHLCVHSLSLTVDFNRVDEAVREASERLEGTLGVNSEAQVLFRIQFTEPIAWVDKYPNAKFETRDKRSALPSICDDAYWDEARRCLVRLVEQLRQHSLRDHMMGIHLDRSEWFLSPQDGYDTSKAARLKFRDWARARYRDDVVALRAAWFDGSVEFNTLQIPPEPVETGGEAERFVRANRKERKWVDYHLMLSDQTEARIADLAYAAKEASEGYFLIGVSYGYTFEWSHPASGHLALGKLLRCPEVDFIAGPPSYQNREPGGAASFPSPIDSFALNGKLFLSEEDYKTSLGVGYDPDSHNPTIRTPQALESVHWRGVGSALAHGTGVSWMDSFGNGWLKTPSVWERAELVREAMIHRMAAKPVAPDVAVFIDERALAYLVDQKGFSLLVQNVRESLMRAGMSAGFYLLSDLQHREEFPDSRLYLFLNAWDIRSELRVAIKNRLQREDKVLFWLYSAALFDLGRESLERAREVTGIALKPQPFHSRTGTTILNRRHPLCEAFPDKTAVGGTRLEPSYFAIPEDALVLGEYTATGLPSFVLREFNHDSDPSLNWKSVFLGEPIVTPALLRALGQMAGAHVWSFTEDVVHVRPPFLTIHCTGAGPRGLSLPGKWCAFDLIEQTWVQTESTSLRFHATDGSTHCFLVGAREDVENILGANPAELLKLAELPSRDENTIRMDAFSFDVPIVRLGEFMDGGETTDLADDLLFKPMLIDESAPDEGEGDFEPTDRVGHRRRRRKRGRGDAPAGRTSDIDFGDAGLGVVFRKRD